MGRGPALRESRPCPFPSAVTRRCPGRENSPTQYLSTEICKGDIDNKEWERQEQRSKEQSYSWRVAGGLALSLQRNDNQHRFGQFCLPWNCTLTEQGRSSLRSLISLRTETSLSLSVTCCFEFRRSENPILLHIISFIKLRVLVHSVSASIIPFYQCRSTGIVFVC